MVVTVKNGVFCGMILCSLVDYMTHSEFRIARTLAKT
jgi:hypothetical protein